MVDFEQRVSAVIPTYNSVKWIGDTIDSLLNQTLNLAEIIVVDDNSQDGTSNYLTENYQGRLKIHHLFENVGSSIARNIGINLVETEWILLMDHDDIADSRLVELEYLRLRELQKQPQSNWVLIHSAYRQINETGAELPGIHSWRQVGPEETLGYLFVRNHILSNSGVLLNKEAALRAGGFDSSLVYSQDWDLWLRMAQSGGFGYVDQPLVKIRRHASNTSRKVSAFLEDELRILKKYDPVFIEKAIHRRHLPWEVNSVDYIGVLYRMGYWDKGYDLLKEVISKTLDFSTAFFLKGLFYLYSKDFTQAETAFNQTLCLEPDHGAALNNIGGIKALQGDSGIAAQILRKAIRLYPDFLDASHNLTLINTKIKLNFEDLKFTWRELRSVLISYIE